jgi:hypothetical protein
MPVRARQGPKLLVCAKTHDSGDVFSGYVLSVTFWIGIERLRMYAAYRLRWWAFLYLCFRYCFPVF